MSAAVLLTFDFDDESPWLAPQPRRADQDLTQRSVGAFGGRRGIGRITDLLDELGISSTFFVPGWTVERHPSKVRELHERGHEIAHHGFHHVAPVDLDTTEQRTDFTRAIEAIVACTGVPPRGYRSPSWQLTATTLGLLGEFGFAYDSSCMGDDRPYLEGHGADRILELPVHWSLDDYPYLAWSAARGGSLRNPAEMIATWRIEVELAIEERRPLVLTCHPEFIGRAAPMRAFAEFVRSLAADPRVSFFRCVDLASELAAGPEPGWGQSA